MNGPLKVSSPSSPNTVHPLALKLKVSLAGRAVHGTILDIDVEGGHVGSPLLRLKC